MTTRRLARRAFAALLAVSGATLCYFAGWVAATEIQPQVLASGWSLERSHLILNRTWQGNELYLLVALYAVVGTALVFAGVRMWGGSGAGRRRR